MTDVAGGRRDLTGPAAAAPSDGRGERSSVAGRLTGAVPDLVAGLGLLVVAFVLRRNGYSRDGLFYDDAWVAIGAIKGSIADIPMTGGAHPGFTLALWIQHHVIGGPAERLAFLALLFGVVGPTVLYAALRSLGYGRAGCLVAGAALAVSPSHVIYSGRVKSYTIDVVLVALIAAVLPRLARRRWTWAGAALWVSVAVLAGSLSGFVVVATALAMGILVLHPSGDRWIRVAALVVQGVVQGGWVLYSRRFVDLDEIEDFMESGYDAHVEWSANPIQLGRNLLEHFQRVVDVHPGAPSSLLLVLALVVLAGLVFGALGALDRDRAIVSRYALAALGFAAIGGVLGRFPFGPSTWDWATALGNPGARHGLWLVPVTAIGLCNVVDLVVDRLSAWSSARSSSRPSEPPAGWLAGRPLLADVVRIAVVAWAVVVVWSRWAPAVEPKPDRHRHVAMVDRAADAGAFVILGEHVAYQYFVLTDRPARLVPTPEEMVGYVPTPDAAWGTVVGPGLPSEDIAAVLAGIDRDKVVIYGVDLPYAEVMRDAGWTRESTYESGLVRVTVWTRDTSG